MGADLPSGKAPTALVLRRILRFGRSMALSARMGHQRFLGKRVRVRVSAEPSLTTPITSPSFDDASSSEATSSALASAAIGRAPAAGREVTCIAGRREKRARGPFLGAAKGGARDAGAVAPREDDSLKGARRLRP